MKRDKEIRTNEPSRKHIFLRILNGIVYFITFILVCICLDDFMRKKYQQFTQVEASEEDKYYIMNINWKEDIPEDCSEISEGMADKIENNVSDSFLRVITIMAAIIWLIYILFEPIIKFYAQEKTKNSPCSKRFSAKILIWMINSTITGWGIYFFAVKYEDDCVRVPEMYESFTFCQIGPIGCLFLASVLFCTPCCLDRDCEERAKLIFLWFLYASFSISFYTTFIVFLGSPKKTTYALLFTTLIEIIDSIYACVEKCN